MKDKTFCYKDAKCCEARRKERARHQREYNKAHREEIIEYKHKWYKEHHEEIAEYRKAHRHERAANTAKRRALKQGALIGATVNQLTEIREIYRRAKEDDKVRCYLCGKLIPKGHRHVDHIVPLSKGGQHRPSNLAVACDVCNLRKQDKYPEEVGLLL